MSMIPKEVVKQLIREANPNSTTEVLDLLREMFKEVLQGAMEAELEEQLGYAKSDVSAKQTDNHRNGYSKKTVKSELGPVELSIPRDRNGEYEPKIITKHERNITGLEEKVLGLYAAGMSTRDIHDQIQELYGVEVSAELVSRITDKVLPLVTEWQSRPLDEVYPFVFMDAIHYKVREDKTVVSKAAYVVLGMNLDGYKEILGIYVGANESSKFWMSVLNELKNRGVKTVCMFCVDGLTGFKEAIGAAFPKAQIQRCIVHQIRSSTRYVSYKDIKEFVQDLKTVYGAVSEELALDNLMTMKDKWGAKYPSSIRSWENNWDCLSTFFNYPPEVRKIIYTTNCIEGLHRQFRKVTKTKAVFPTDQSLLKMLCLAQDKIQKKWTQRQRSWDLVLAQLQLLFAEQLAS